MSDKSRWGTPDNPSPEAIKKLRDNVIFKPGQAPGGGSGSGGKPPGGGGCLLILAQMGLVGLGWVLRNSSRGRKVPGAQHLKRGDGR